MKNRKKVEITETLL